MTRLKKVFNFIYFQSWNFGFWHPPDRLFLKNKIFKFFREDPSCRTVLFVGIRRYTRSYESYFIAKERYVTIDYDPKMKKFGGAMHFVSDVCTLSNLPVMGQSSFDVVFLNGIVGYGVNDLVACRKAVDEIAKVLRPSGWLIVGASPKALGQAKFEELMKADSRFKKTVFPPTGQMSHDFVLPGYSDVGHRYLFFRAERIS